MTTLVLACKTNLDSVFVLVYELKHVKYYPAKTEIISELGVRIELGHCYLLLNLMSDLVICWANINLIVTYKNSVWNCNKR